MGGILMLAGLGLMLLGFILILVSAFKESILWGLGCLFIHIVALVFVLTHWEESKSGFLLYVGGIGAIVLGAMMGGNFKASPFL